MKSYNMKYVPAKKKSSKKIKNVREHQNVESLELKKIITDRYGKRFQGEEGKEERKQENCIFDTSKFTKL